jgi:PAS domain S-box-containing protein
MLESKGTILVACEEQDSLALIAGILRDGGYAVQLAESGEMALELAVKCIPDLILLSLRLPDQGGLEVCRRLKTQEQTQEVPVMFLGGSSNQQERDQALALGALGFVVKPFLPPDVLDCVCTHLDLRRLRRDVTQMRERSRELRLDVQRLRREVTERAQRESDERFRSMANTAPVMIVASDPGEYGSFFNKEWLQFTGRSFEQELGEGWVEGVHPADRESTIAGLAASFSARRECCLEYRLRRADGEYRSVLCRGVPRFEPDGTFAGYIATAVDISDVKQRQEVALARQKFESLGMLAGGIAHDFNNLLGSIMANTELLLEEVGGNAAAQETARKIDAVALRAAEIVRQFMAYAGQESEAFEAVDLASLVSEMLELVNVSISKTAILRIELPEKLPRVLADAAQLRQVVMNLITNASEALNEKGGVISVNASEVRLSPGPGLPEGNYLQLEVSDTGAGMNEETQTRIFDPYFTTKATGRGLGLAAVQGIIRSHRGALRVKSSLGQGSCFTILLPCESKTASIPPAPVARPARETLHLEGAVLIVEDEHALRDAARKILQRFGLTVIDSPDGAGGIEFFRAAHSEIDIVLLDLTLPGISGAEVLKELRRIEPEVKVIITSAYSRDWVFAALGDARPWSYLRKPYRSGELLEMLRSAGLEKQRAGSQAAG